VASLDRLALLALAPWRPRRNGSLERRRQTHHVPRYDSSRTETSAQEGAGWPHRSLFVRTPHIGRAENAACFSYSPPRFSRRRGNRHPRPLCSSPEPLRYCRAPVLRSRWPLTSQAYKDAGHPLRRLNCPRPFVRLEGGLDLMGVRDRIKGIHQQFRNVMRMQSIRFKQDACVIQ
jgi:hypothetical protein